MVERVRERRSTVVFFDRIPTADPLPAFPLRRRNSLPTFLASNQPASLSRRVSHVFRSSANDEFKDICLLLAKLNKRKRPPHSLDIPDPEAIALLPPSFRRSPIAAATTYKHNPEETTDHLLQLRDKLLDDDVWIDLEQHSQHSSAAASSARRAVPNFFIGQTPSGEDSTSCSQREERESSYFPDSSGHDRPMTSVQSVLTACLELVGDIIQTDCRYETMSPRPFRPPLTLQVAVLDLARILILRHSKSSDWLVEVGFTILPAFTVFPKRLHSRILEFFANILLPPLVTRHNLKNDRVPITISLPAGNIPAGKRRASSLRFKSSTSLVDFSQEKVMDDDKNRILQTKPGTISCDISSSSSRNALPLLGPLMTAIVEQSGHRKSDMGFVYYELRILEVIIHSKPDLFIELLDMVAHGTYEHRKRAIEILFHFWPFALGHPSIAYPPESIEPVLVQGDRTANRHRHTFCPFLFPSSDAHCKTCRLPVNGYGVRCHGCGTSMHPNCLPQLNNRQFWEIPCGPRNLTDRSVNREEGLGVHRFVPCNVLALVLCTYCHLPLWGLVAQGSRCSLCGDFAHDGCLQDQSRRGSDCLNSGDAKRRHEKNITNERLRTDFAAFYCDMPFVKPQIHCAGPAEVSITRDVLSLQKAIIAAGIEQESILISDTSGPGNTSVIELDRMIDALRATLREQDLPSSSAGKGSFEPESHSVGFAEEEFSVLFSKNSLSELAVGLCTGTKCASLEESVAETSASTTGSLGDVSTSGPFAESHGMDRTPNRQTVSTLVKRIGKHLNLETTGPAMYILQQMHARGLLERLDGHEKLFNAGTENDAECIFAVPHGSDRRAAPDIFVQAIRLLLGDLDVTLNECALLLLTRRGWPYPSFPKPVLANLVGVVTSWISSEESRSETVQRDYAMRKKRVPGLRGNEEIDAPDRVSGLYVMACSALREKYAADWLKAAHDLNPKDYATAVLARLKVLYRHVGAKSAYDAEAVVCAVLRLDSAAVTFSVLEDLLLSWIDDLCTETEHRPISKVLAPEVTKVIHRLCFGTVDPSPSRMIGSRVDSGNDMHTSVNLMALILRPASWTSLSNIESSVRRLALLQRAGVGIPMEFLSQISDSLALVQDNVECHWKYLELIWYQCSNGGLSVVPSRNILLAAVVKSIQAPIDLIDSLVTKDDKILAGSRCLIRTAVKVFLFAHGCHMDDGSNSAIDPASFVYPVVNGTPPDQSHHQTLARAIRYLLHYVRIPELREPLLCGFAKLMERNGIDAALFKSDYQLSSCVWEMLSPTYDHMAASLVPITLRLLETDPSKLHDIAEKRFLTPSWTSRFQGLDNLYGLFIKLNAPVVEKEQKPVLKVLGRLFGFFLSCLWDPEEPVRTKAMTYVGCMNLFKIKVGLRAWGVYFDLGNHKEKITVCKQMLQANAIFPKWKVLDWEIALDHLEKRNGSKEENTDQRDLNCYLVNLAIQMIASGVDISLLHLRRLKHLVCIYAGFSDCTLDRIGSETVPIVKFGRLVFDASDHAQHAALSTLVRGLRDILDKAIEEPSQFHPDSPEKEVRRVGNEFVDMALMLFSSDLDLTKIGDLMLKEWLELVQIVIYKYNVDEISGKLVSVVKEVTNVLDSNISEENKQRGISICLSLLRRSTVITASVLSRQILSMGKLLMRLKENRNAVAACKARQFLKLAFKNYATNGLFVLLFKNPSKMDMCNGQPDVNHEDAEIDVFFVLKEVLFDDNRTANDGNHDGVENDESILLREEPIKDVLGRLLLFKELNRRSFSTVLLNLSLYMENVFPGYYEPELLHDFGMFIPKLLRHTADWKRSEWDINPTMAIAASIMRVHPTECPGLLAPVKSLVKHAILRCSVTLASVVLVLNACYMVASFAERETAGLAERFVFDELRWTLRGKTRMSKCTFLALVQLVCWERCRDLPTDLPCLTAEDLEKVEAEIQSLPITATVEFFGENTPSLLEDCVAYLEGFRWNQPEDFEIGIWTTQLLISLSSSVLSPFSTLLSSQKTTDVSRTLKLLNWITLGLLRNPIPKLISGSLDFEAGMSQLIIHALEHHHAPLPHHGSENYQQTDSGPPVSGPVFLSFLLLKMRTALGTLILCGNSTCSEEKTWISVWPYFRRRLVVPSLSMNAREVNDFVTFWEQFLNLALFLHGCSAEVSLSYKDEWCSLMENVSQKFNVPSLVAKIQNVQSVLDAPQPSWDVRNAIVGLTVEWEAGLRVMSLQGRKM